MIKKVREKYPKLMIEVCGSHRRGKQLSGDIDVLICHPDINNEIDLIMSTKHYLKVHKKGAKKKKVKKIK